jgi:hypothetical protein
MVAEQLVFERLYVEERKVIIDKKMHGGEGG